MIIPNGINTSKFKNMSVKKKYDLIYVGRLIDLKGACELLHFIEKNNKLKFLLIGKVAIQYKEKVKKLKNIVHIEHIPNDQLPSYFNQAYAYISFAHTEGSPKACIEAIACGLLPILSDIPAHRFVLGNTFNDIPRINFEDNLKKELLINMCAQFNNVDIIKNFDMEELISKESKFMLDFLRI